MLTGVGSNRLVVLSFFQPGHPFRIFVWLPGGIILYLKFIVRLTIAQAIGILELFDLLDCGIDAFAHPVSERLSQVHDSL